MRPVLDRDTTGRSTRWARAAGLVGATAAVVGFWMMCAPADGRFRLLAWEWSGADLAGPLPWLLMVAGSAVVAAAATLYARTVLARDGYMSLEAEVALAVCMAGVMVCAVTAVMWAF